MDIIEKTIPHIFRNKYLRGQGGTIIMGSSRGSFNSSSTTGSGGASSLDDLTDVTVDYLNNEDILQYDETIGQWVNKALEVDWNRVNNTPTTLEGYGITDAVHISHLDDNVKHITSEERKTWNKTTTDFNTHNADEVRHITAEERESWDNPMIKKLKDVKLDDVKDNDILIYRETDDLWHNEQLPEYDWKKILKVNEDGEVVSKFDIVVEGECFIWYEEADRELTPIKDADSYKLISSLGDELRISANLIIVRNISYESSNSPITEAEITNYIGITDNGDIIINSLRLADRDLFIVDPAIQTEKNDYLKDALYFDSSGCLRCSRPFIGDKTISVAGGSNDTLTGAKIGVGGSADVVDALDSTDINSALSANQGRVLNEKIESLTFSDLKEHPTTLEGYGITESILTDQELEKHAESTSHITTTERNLWNAASNLKHQHHNDNILENIWQEDIDRWNSASADNEIFVDRINEVNTRVDEVDKIISQKKDVVINTKYWYEFITIQNGGYVLVNISIHSHESRLYSISYTSLGGLSITELNRTGSNNYLEVGHNGMSIFVRYDISKFAGNVVTASISTIGHGFNLYKPDSYTISGVTVVNPKDSLDFYTKAEIDNLFDSIEIPEATDLSNYYNKSEVDSLIGGIEIPEATDLTNYYNKSEVDSLIGSIEIPETDLSNYYNKEEVNALIDAIEIPESGGSEASSNVVSFSATRNRYYKLFSLSVNGTVNFTIQSGATSGGSYTFTISYLNTKGIAVKQLCGSGSGFSNVLYKKNGDVYDIYISIDSTATVTFISSGFNYNTYESPSYVTSSSGMTSFSIKENTISTYDLVATGSIKSYSYYVENSDGTYSNLVSLINSLESRIEALEGGA